MKQRADRSHTLCSRSFCPSHTPGTFLWNHRPTECNLKITACIQNMSEQTPREEMLLRAPESVMLVFWGVMIHPPNKNLLPFLQGHFTPERTAHRIGLLHSHHSHSKLHVHYTLITFSNYCPFVLALLTYSNQTHLYCPRHGARFNRSF